MVSHAMIAMIVSPAGENTLEAKMSGVNLFYLALNVLENLTLRDMFAMAVMPS